MSSTKVITIIEVISSMQESEAQVRALAGDAASTEETLVAELSRSLRLEAEIASQEEAISSKDQEIASKDEEITSKEVEIASKEEEISSKDAALGAERERREEERRRDGATRAVADSLAEELRNLSNESAILCGELRSAPEGGSGGGWERDEMARELAKQEAAVEAWKHEAHRLERTLSVQDERVREAVQDADATARSLAELQGYTQPSSTNHVRLQSWFKTQYKSRPFTILV